MKLKVARKWFTEKSTTGILYVDDKFFCYTLEDVVRPAGEKVPGKTAIPWGTYPLVITYSDRFKRALPLLIGVPNFVGVRMHAGNSAGNTEGCILLGLTHSTDWVGSSRMAVEQLLDRLDDAYEVKEPITIEIAAEATA